MKLKRLSAGLLMLALLLTLFAFPAAADNTYSVTLPAGATGPDTVAAGEDYTFTLAEDINVVAYAEFPDGSICAAEAKAVYSDGNSGTIVGYTRTIPGEFVTGNFTIHTFAVDTTTVYDSNNVAFFEGGTGTSETPYQIATELQLLQLMAATTSDNATGASASIYDDAGIYYILTDDISFHTPISMQLAPIQGSGTQKFCYSSIGRITFASTLDGNGHTISSLHIGSKNTGGMSLIPYNSGVIKNLHLASIENNAVTQSAGVETYVSLLVGKNESDGSILNCFVNGDILYNAVAPQNNNQICNAYFGLIAGQNYGQINGCKATGNIHIQSENSKGVYVGLISGYNCGGTISDCVADGTVLQEGKSGNNYIGGIAGQSIQSNNVKKAVISTCINHSVVTGTTGTSGTAYIGGIAGVTQGNANYKSEIVNCINDGVVTTLSSGGKNEYVGGIAGRALSAGNVTGCYNLGNVSSHGTNTNYAGGIIGQNNASAVTVKACFSYVSGLNAIGMQMTKNLSYTYILANNTDSDADETSEEKELSAADFKAASLVATLNTALGENIFVAGTDYPVFSWLAASTPATDLTASVTNSTGATPLATVTAEAEGSTATITVNCEKACVVIAYDGTDYVCLNGTGSGTEYTFTADYIESTTTFTVAVRGDADGNGSINANDLSLFVNACNGDYSSFTYAAGVALLIGDTDGNNTMNANDLSTLVNVCNGSALDWLTD